MTRRTKASPATAARRNGPASSARAKAASSDSEALRGQVLAHLDSAIACVGPRVAPSDKSVHQTRKAVKRARALMRLLRPAIEIEAFEACREGLRRAAHSVADARDATAMAAALKNVTRRSGLTEPGIVLESARMSKDADAQTRQLLTQQAAAFSHLKDVRRRVTELSFSADASELLLSGIRTIYRRARKRVPLESTDDKTEALHEWRKDVKAFWHVLEVLPAKASPRTRQMVHEARRLAGILGEDHDLALLSARLKKNANSAAGKAQRVVIESIATRRKRLQKRAQSIGAGLFRNSPREFESEIRRELRDSRPGRSRRR